MTRPNRKAVLVPIDFSDASFAAVDEALTLVESPTGVYVIHVLPSIETEADFICEALEATSRDARAESAIRERIDGARTGVQVIIRTGVVGDVIATTAEEIDCDLIVMPSRGRLGVLRLLLGSVTWRVLRLAKIPVLVLRGSRSR